MNIQISVTIWTLICFAVLYLILKFLLFNPVHKVMDEREKKMNEAKSKKAEAEQMLEQRRIENEKALELAQKQHEEESKEKIEEIRQKGRKLLEEAREERAKSAEEFRREVAEEYDSDIASATDKMPEIADRFLDSIFAE